jgi:hypothetical protein
MAGAQKRPVVLSRIRLEAEAGRCRTVTSESDEVLAKDLVLAGAPRRYLVQILVQSANLLTFVLEVHADEIADREHR